MKKITAILMFLAVATFSFGQVAGEYFKPVGWGASPSDVDWSANAYTNDIVTIKMANANMDGVLDISTLTAEDLANIWDRLGDANLIAGQTDTNHDPDPFDLDENGDGTFGACWKAFYDSQSLFIIYKFVDSEGLSTARWFESAIQTKEYDRYEAGWQAASQVDTTGVGYTLMNDQYGRFKELGGMKIKVDETETVVENVTSIGQSGTWGNAIGGTAVGDVVTLLEADGTLWYVLQLDFADLKFYDDEWGTDDASNLVAMDPTTETIISFEPTSRATINDAEYAAWWHGVNDGYKYVYYAGNIEFGDEVFDPVGINATTAVSQKSAYIYNDMLRLKGFDNPVDLNVYSITGQKIMSAKNVSGELNVSQLNEGVYIIMVDGSREAFKVLK